jgi:hypothetical protein
MQCVMAKPVHGHLVALRPTESDYDHASIPRRQTAWMATATPVNLEGTMRAMVCVRGLLLVAGIAACGALWPSASRAFTQEDARRLCTPDVLRLCSSEIPDVERITACMRRHRANLSEGCRSVFGKSAQSASADK